MLQEYPPWVRMLELSENFALQNFLSKGKPYWSFLADMLTLKFPLHKYCLHIGTDFKRVTYYTSLHIPKYAHLYGDMTTIFGLLFFFF